MPYRPDTPCKHPGCPALVPYGSKYCEKHKALHTEERDGAFARGYNAKWQKARKLFLTAHPFCVECYKEGVMMQATVVDHIIPHRGDEKLFWNRDNWQALCKRHHDQKTMTKDRYKEYKF